MPKNNTIFDKDPRIDAMIQEWARAKGLGKHENDKIDLKTIAENASRKINPQQFLSEEQIELDEGDDIDSEIQGGLRQMVHAAVMDDQDLFQSAFEEVLLMKIVKTLNYVKEEIRAEWTNQFKDI